VRERARAEVISGGAEDRERLLEVFARAPLSFHVEDRERTGGVERTRAEGGGRRGAGKGERAPDCRGSGAKMSPDVPEAPERPGDP
jgi:hypothetical protein